MIILNFGIPRSGTVWAFNVCRKIWETEQIPYETVNPTSRDEVDAVIDSLDQSQNLIIHGHDITTKVVRIAQSNAVRPFFNYRDPRDVVVSQMRLHDAPFETAIQWTVNAYQQFEAALTLPGIMIIPYNHIADHAEAIIYQMATKLGVLLNLQDVRRIAEETSYERHQRLMDHMNRQDHAGAAAQFESINLSSRDMRFDRDHLITDRHLQSGRNGRWREELSQQQQDVVQRSFSPLVERLGFENAAV